MATRLQGDYKTGKRLNMKRIIPYIASDFTKDKIWLRRTRPSQREYQIMISLDDSKSMIDSHSAQLAFESLALVITALSKLEVGEVAITRFGETTEICHTFDNGPITDDVGTKLVDVFTFNQKGTNMTELLQVSLAEFIRARKSLGPSSHTDLWQLQIIISDGICQSVEKIRALLRRATEERIHVVFIIVDSLYGRNDSSRQSIDHSITSMQSASYIQTSDGRMELKMERYLDKFPFDYYIILQNADTLPEVLGQTLQQFFEKVGTFSCS